jgi:hypothetical protein
MSVGADVPIRPPRPSPFVGAHLRVRPERHDTHRGRPDALIGPERGTLYSVIKTNKSTEMRNLISVQLTKTGLKN